MARYEEQREYRERKLQHRDRDKDQVETCEMCHKKGGKMTSDPRAEELGVGMVLCKKCAKQADKMSDDLLMERCEG